MAFKPSQQPSSGGGSGEFREYPVPKSGSRPARVSLIVDLGIQNRPDFEDEKTGEKKPQSPAHQLAVFADLVRDVVDYGGDIGKQQYRMLLNKVYDNVMQGVNFTSVLPRDKQGQIIKNKPATFHPTNLLTKISKAVGKPEVIEHMDVEELLGEAMMVTVEVKIKESDKHKNEDGTPKVFKNVHFKGVAEVPTVEDEDGNEEPMVIPELRNPARCVTFDNATVEDIKQLRRNIIEMIKTANNYDGSQMEKAIKAFEANKPAKKEETVEQDAKEVETPAEDAPPPKKEKKPSAKKTAPPPVGEEAEDDDSPF